MIACIHFNPTLKDKGTMGITKVLSDQVFTADPARFIGYPVNNVNRYLCICKYTKRQVREREWGLGCKFMQIYAEYEYIEYVQCLLLWPLSYAGASL